MNDVSNRMRANRMLSLRRELVDVSKPDRVSSPDQDQLVASAPKKHDDAISTVSRHTAEN